MTEHAFRLSNTWFADASEKLWDQLLPYADFGKVLEVGSYEGASACHLIRRVAALRALELHCVDSWEGGVEHRAGGTAEADMGAVERNFLHNTQLACGEAQFAVTLRRHKSFSDLAMARLLAEGHAGQFDYIYIDGSHEAPDVLADAVLAFRLLKQGGIIGFDDYWWHEPLPGGRDPIRTPKLAIDAFTNIYCRKVETLWHPNYQVYLRKTAD
jgi:predicted O-methyltransferase YrrM